MPKKSKDYELGREMGALTGEIKVLTSAVGTLTTEISGIKNVMGPKIDVHSEKIIALETHRDSDFNFLKGINEKLKNHIRDHWKWVTTLTGILAVLGGLMAYMSKN